MKCVIIYNPNSGKLTNRNSMNRIFRIFENYNYEIEVIYTEYAGHAKQITKKLKNVDLLVCAGGDGTLNEVIAGNIERKDKLLLGHLPLGSVNDVAHMYGMTNNVHKNVLMLLNGVSKNIDVCTINGSPFVYVACLGAFVDISYSTPRKLKEKYGRFAYVIYALQQLKQQLKFFNIKYTVDGEVKEGKFSFIFITNSSRISGINDIVPDVKLDDNMFEVFLMDIRSKFDIFKAVHYITRKDIGNIPGCIYFKTSNIKLEFEEVPPSWCIDGDELSHNDKVFDIKINKDNNMIVPCKNLDKLFEKTDDE